MNMDEAWLWHIRHQDVVVIMIITSNKNINMYTAELALGF